jgi:ribosome-interacting GTPase 1
LMLIGCSNIYLKAKKAGGMKISFSSTPKHLDEKMIYNILRDYKMLNCEVLIRDDDATVDDLIDVIMKDHRKYIRWYGSKSTNRRTDVLVYTCTTRLIVSVSSTWISSRANHTPKS